MRAYGLAILFVYGLSSFSLASEVHQRLREARRRISLFGVYLALLGLVAASGAVVVGLAEILPASPLGWVASVVVGVAAGEVILRCDRSIVRFVRRRGVGRAPERPTARRIEPPRLVSEPTPTSAGSRRGLRARRTSREPSHDQAFAAASPRTAATIAALEELIFRGFLLTAALQLSGIPGAAAVIALVAAFALSHIWFGWVQVAAKIPLGVIATVCVLLIGGVIVAVVAHLVFNLRVSTRRSVGSMRRA